MDILNKPQEYFIGQRILVKLPPLDQIWEMEILKISPSGTHIKYLSVLDGNKYWVERKYMDKYYLEEL